MLRQVSAPRSTGSRVFTSRPPPTSREKQPTRPHANDREGRRGGHLLFRSSCHGRDPRGGVQVSAKRQVALHCRRLPCLCPGPGCSRAGWRPTGLSSLLQVYYLGEGETSRQWLQQEQNTTATLCLSHVRAVASHVRARHPATTPLVWDDMLRDIPEDQLSGQRRVHGRRRRLLLSPVCSGD